jgi:fatty-acyl-CoA synthase
MSIASDRAHYKFWPKRMPRELTLPAHSLWRNLDITTQRYPHKTAFVFGDESLTFRELHHKVEALAAWLQQVAQVKKGDRVLLIAQNSLTFVIAAYAVLRADAVLVPVNPMNKAEELKHYITDPQARVAVCMPEMLDDLLTANAQTAKDLQLQHILVGQYLAYPVENKAVSAHKIWPAAWSSWLYASATEACKKPSSAALCTLDDAIKASHTPRAHNTAPDDLAILPYTSGTTGLPKGCMHTQASIMHNVVAGTLWGQGNADTVALSVVPMFHITGHLYGLHGPIYSGCVSVIMPRWDRELAGHLISTYKVTAWTNIPTMVIDLFASPNIEKFNLSSLQLISGGGAAMPQAIAQKLLEQFDLRYVEGYGLTETAAPSHSNPPDRPKQQCLGIPYIGVDARVLDPVTLLELPVEEVGEIIIHGPQVFKGYWQRPEANEQAFIEFEGKSFFRSGDLGRVDEEGYFFITDRLKRMINASGFKVWPAEVEALLYKHPAVQEACIIASHDAYRGETVKAVVVLRASHKGQVSEQDIIDWAKDNMAAYKAPKLVSFAESLPKSGSGKVMWRLLQESEAQK